MTSTGTRRCGRCDTPATCTTTCGCTGERKILEWSNTPEYAFRTALYLNNKYFLDSRDPNSFANVAWIFGVHDRGWTEREVFGKVRYMSAGGLERKAKPKGYVEKVNRLGEEGF